MAHGLQKVKFITWFSYENFILHSLQYKHFAKWKEIVHNVREKFMPLNQLPAQQLA